MSMTISKVQKKNHIQVDIVSVLNRNPYTYLHKIQVQARNEF